jgi:hypothetical protein
MMYTNNRNKTMDLDITKEKTDLNITLAKNKKTYLNIILAKARNKSVHYLSKNKEHIYLMCMLLSSFLYAQKKL